MNKCLIVARNTFREAIRDRILYLIGVFAVVVIVLSKAIAWVSVNQDADVIIDISLAAISLFSVVIAVFVGTGLIFKELDKRTIYTILSKPVERWQFVVGKYLGLAMVISLVALLMELFFVLFMAVQQGYLPTGDQQRMLVYALILVHGEILIVTAVAIFFSLLTSPILSAVLTLIVWVAGNSSNELLNLGATFRDLAADDGQIYLLMEKFTFGLYCVTPHLNYFSEVKYFVSWNDPEAIAGITFSLVAMRMAYAVCYASVLLALSVLAFRRRSF